VLRAAGDTETRKEMPKMGLSWLKKTLDFSFLSFYNFSIGGRGSTVISYVFSVFFLLEGVFTSVIRMIPIMPD
jgi:hypothetical protein